MDDNNDIFHIMHTMRAMRRLKPDPVPDELIEKILIAGTAAPNLCLRPWLEESSGPSYNGSKVSTWKDA